MTLVERVKNLLLQPKFEWPKIADEPASVGSVFTGYVMILAAIGPIVMALKGSVIAAIAGYLLGLGITYLLAMIVDALAPTFGGEKNFVQSLKLVAYSYTAAWVAAVLQIIPFLGVVLSLLGAIYAWYTFYLGVAVMKKCPEEKAVVYTVAIVVCGILLTMALFGVLMSLLFGGAMLTGAALMH
jgi:small-conductance mechanosensitive channel